MKLPWLQGAPLACILLLLSSCAAPLPRRAYFPSANLNCQVFSAPQVLAGARRQGFGGAPNAVMLAIDENSSFRAVADAVLRLREGNLAVGYWVDARLADDASRGFDARLAHVRAVLNNRPPADAIFLAGLQGERLYCGCYRTLCGATDDVLVPETCARFVAALRGFTGGAIVVPVWADEGGLKPEACASPPCIEARCGERGARAFGCVRAESTRVALQFSSPAPAAPASFVAERLMGWSRLKAYAPSAVPGSAATLLAVLPGLDWQSTELEQAVAAVRSRDRGGFLIVEGPLPGQVADTDPAR